MASSGASCNAARPDSSSSLSNVVRALNSTPEGLDLAIPGAVYEEDEEEDDTD